MPPDKNSYLHAITEDQATRLRELLLDQGWTVDAVPHAWWRAQKTKTTVVAYLSGKLLVQGRGTAELVEFILEPQLFNEARFGYERELVKQEKPAMFEPHAGIDESGKGDFFGPLVIAACYTDGHTAECMLELGVQDSKAIKSQKKIETLAQRIRELTRGKFAIVSIGPEAYNRLYTQFGNVNRMLAWGHARALEDLLAKVPDCPRAISDQFGQKHLIERALKERGKAIILEQMPKAEADVAVAAASILAREEFVRRLGVLGQRAGITLPKGASQQVLEVAATLLRQGGEAALAPFVKLHFKSTQDALALASGQPPQPADGGAPTDGGAKTDSE